MSRVIMTPETRLSYRFTVVSPKDNQPIKIRFDKKLHLLTLTGSNEERNLARSNPDTFF